MRACPECGSDEVRAAECIELVYEIRSDGRPDDLINVDDVFREGPIEGGFYYLCMECNHRWDVGGVAVIAPTPVPRPARGN